MIENAHQDVHRFEHLHPEIIENIIINNNILGTPPNPLIAIMQEKRFLLEHVGFALGLPMTADTEESQKHIQSPSGLRAHILEMFSIPFHPPDSNFHYPFSTAKGTGVTDESAKERALQFSDKPLTSLEDIRRILRTEGIIDGPHGFFNLERALKELEYSELLNSRGVRVPRVIAIMEINPDKMKEFLESQSELLEQSGYPVLEMLQVMVKSGQKPAIIVRLDAPRIEDGLKAVDSGQFSKEDIVRMSINTLLADLQIVGEDMFTANYGITNNESENIEQFLLRLQTSSFNSISPADFERWVGLEAQLLGHNYGRLTTAAKELHLNIEFPKNAQNTTLCGGGFADHEVTEEYSPDDEPYWWNPNSPFNKVIGWKKEVVGYLVHVVQNISSERTTPRRNAIQRACMKAFESGYQRGVQ